MVLTNKTMIPGQWTNEYKWSAKYLYFIYKLELIKKKKNLKIKRTIYYKADDKEEINLGLINEESYKNTH